MRINTSGSYKFRKDLYEEAADIFGESTKVGGIDAACTHARRDRRAKRDALSYAVEHLPPPKAEELADRLSTPSLELSVNVETEVGSLDG